MGGILPKQSTIQLLPVNGGKPRQAIGLQMPSLNIQPLRLKRTQNGDQIKNFGRKSVFNGPHGGQRARR
jgi:hypothetical protein